jgi:hypothetical protein
VTKQAPFQSRAKQDALSTQSPDLVKSYPVHTIAAAHRNGYVGEVSDVI